MEDIEECQDIKVYVLSEEAGAFHHVCRWWETNYGYRSPGI